MRDDSEVLRNILGHKVLHDLFAYPARTKTSLSRNLKAPAGGNLIPAFLGVDELYICIGGFSVGEWDINIPNAIFVFSADVRKLQETDRVINPVVKKTLSEYSRSLDYYGSQAMSLFTHVLSFFIARSVGLLDLSVVKNYKRLSSDNTDRSVLKCAEDNDVELIRNYISKKLENIEVGMLRYYSPSFIHFAFGTDGLEENDRVHYFEWLSQGMPEGDDFDWLSFHLEYICGIEAAVVMSVVDDKDMLLAIRDELKRIWHYVNGRIDRIKKDNCLNPRLNHAVQANIMLAMVENLIATMSSLDTVFLQQGNKDKSKKITDMEFNQLLVDCAYYATESSKWLTAASHIDNPGTKAPQIEEFSANKYWYYFDNLISEGALDHYVAIGHICADIQNLVLEDNVSYRRMKIMLALYNSDYTSYAWGELCRGLVKNMCHGFTFEGKSLGNVIKLGYDKLNLISKRELPRISYRYGYIHLTDSMQLQYDKIKKLFMTYGSGNYAVFDSDYEFPHMESLAHLNLPLGDLEQLMENGYLASGIDRLRAYLLASNELQRYLERPQDPFAKLFLEKNGMSCLAGEIEGPEYSCVCTGEDLARCTTIVRKIGTTQSDLIYEAASIWGYSIWPERIQPKDVSLTDTGLMVIYRKSIDTVDSMIIQRQPYFDYRISVLLNVLLPILAGALCGVGRADQSLDTNLTKGVDAKALLADFRAFINAALVHASWLEELSRSPKFNRKLVEAVCFTGKILAQADSVQAQEFCGISAKKADLHAELFKLNSGLGWTFITNLLETALKTGNGTVSTHLVTVIGTLASNWLLPEDIKNATALTDDEISEVLVESSVASKLVRSGTVLIEGIGHARGVNIVITGIKRKNGKKKQEALDAPVALNIDEDKLNDVLRNTASVRVSLDRIFAEQEVQDIMDAQDPALTSGTAANCKNANAMVAASANVKASANANISAMPDTRVGAGNESALHASEQKDSGKVKSAKGGKGTGVARKNASARKDANLLAEISEALDIIGTKTLWDESDLRRAYGKRSMLLGKFIDLLNEKSLELYDDYVVSSEDGEVDIEEDYFNGVKEAIISSMS